jgi:predicted RNA-binding Zn-ribbon protein involved in translation (DUF1610 family)
MEPSKIESLVREVLSREFPGSPSKQRIYPSGNRLNFSCPYCGDSNDARKKRGNFYMDTQAYKCYNGGCGVFKSSLSFFNEFGVYGKLSREEISEIKKILDENRDKRRPIIGSTDISMFFEDDINKFIIPRSQFMESLGLKDVSGQPIERYLRKRYQSVDNRFAWDPKKEKLFLFNLNKEDKIIGLQLRNMNSIKGSSKYLTYKLSGIWEKLLFCKDNEFLDGCRKIDPISSVFNVATIDFGEDITIFEGPMDSWLWKNSVGLCSVENRFPFDVENIRFWYDWDKAGLNKSIELLTSGFKVFNWGKFLEDHTITKNRKWDLNDLVIHLRKTGKKIRRFENYFTDDVLDLGYFIDG